MVKYEHCDSTREEVDVVGTSGCRADVANDKAYVSRPQMISLAIGESRLFLRERSIKHQFDL